MKTKSDVVTVERLDRAYCCTQCNAVYLFASDVLEHQQQTGHMRQFFEIPLEEPTEFGT